MKAFIKYIVFFAGLAAVVACQNENIKNTEVNTTKSQEENTIILNTEQYNLANIQLGKAREMTISRMIKLNGKVKSLPNGVLSVSSPMGGYIRKLELQPGQEVKKGQVLAQIEDMAFIELQKDYLEAKATLLYMEKELTRQKALNQQKINSNKVLQEVESKYQSALVSTKALEEKLNLIHINPAKVKATSLTSSAIITAPWDGFVGVINVNTGDYLNPQEVMMTLINPERIILELNTFEKEVHNIEKDANIFFTRSTSNKYNLSAKVKHKGVTINTDSTTPIIGEIEDESKQGLLPGMYIKAKVASSTSLQTVVPEAAIIKYQNQDYVMALKEKNKEGYVFKMTPIIVKQIQDGNVAIVLPQTFSLQNSIATANAYAIIAAKINAEEEE